MYLLEAHRRLAHVNRIRDDPEVHRPQMVDAVDQEGILPADDLARHFQDRVGALIEAVEKGADPDHLKPYRGRMGKCSGRPYRRQGDYWTACFTTRR